MPIALAAVDLHQGRSLTVQRCAIVVWRDVNLGALLPGVVRTILIDGVYHTLVASVVPAIV